MMNRNGTPDEYHPAYDPETGAYRTEFDRASEKSLGIAVVRAIAALTGENPCDLDETLYDVIEPDALDMLFDPKSGRGSWSATERGRESPTGREEEPTAGVWFTFAGHRVIAYGDGLIEIVPLGTEGDPDR